MADKVNRIVPAGNMDKDSDIRYVGKGNNAGDYLDARNIHAVPEDGNIQGSAPPTLGNKFAFDLGSVSQQNKRYRITLDGDATKQHEIRFLSTQRDQNMVVGTGANGALAFNGTTLSFLSAFNAAIAGTGVSWSVQVPPLTPNIIEIELASYPMYQWYMESSGPDTVEVTCIAEAIPVDLAGPLKDIGSYDLLGDLFIFSTTQDNEPTEITPTIILAGPTSGGNYVGPLTSILFNGPHGLVAGQWIRITNCNEAFLNGLFVVHSVIDPFTARIVTATAWGGVFPVTTLGSPSVFTHPSGIGEIGIAKKDDNTDQWTYTRLLRSVELNFVSKWQVDCTFNRDGERSAGYYTDDYNVPRGFYYYGSNFQPDGALNFILQENIYLYGNIAVQSTHFSTPTDVVVSFVNQIQTGGSLSPGNKWYAARFIDIDNNTTPFTQLYGPVNVYKNNNFGAPGEAAGSDSSEETGKINVISVSGYPQGVYQNIEIGVLSSNGGAVSASLIGPYAIQGEVTIIRHSGFETESQFLDVAELIPIGDGFFPVKAKSVREIDQRLVMSNIVTVSSIDLSDWAKRITHSLKKKRIEQKRAGGTYEYEMPENTFNFAGYMLDETYRFGVRVKFKNFGWTDVFWVDDIVINTDPVNTANPDGDNRRILPLMDYDLTVDSSPVDKSDFISSIDPQNPATPNGFGPNGIIPLDVYDYEQIMIAQGKDVNGTYPDSERGRGLKWADLDVYESKLPPDGGKELLIPYVEFDIDIDYAIPELNGLLFSEVVEGVSFVRGNTPNFIVGNGLGVMSIEAVRVINTAEVLIDTEFPPNSSLPTTGEIYYSEYPFWCGASLDEFDDFQAGTDNGMWPSYPYQNPGYPQSSSGPKPPVFFSENRSVLSIYSPDTILKGDVEGVKPTTLITTGVPEMYKAKRFLETDRNYIAYYMPQYQGQKVEYGIDFYQYLDDGGSVDSTQSFGGILFTKKFSRPVTEMNCTRGPVIKTSSQVQFPGSTETGATSFNQSLDRGVVFCRMYRDVLTDFPRIETTNYIGCGHFYRINGQTGSSIQVFGGDTFTGTNFVRTRTLFDQASSSGNFWGQGTGVCFVAQSRANPNMRGASENNFVFYVDTNDEREWLNAPNNLALDPSGNPINWIQKIISIEYNQGYDLGVEFASFSTAEAYRRTLGLGDFPVRVIYSIRKIEEAVIDSYKTLLPINFKDLDLTFGEIFHHENVNGELFTLQPRKWQRQLFNTRGELQVEGNALGAVIGDGSVLARDGQTLSRYGTQNKWSVVLGTSPGGKDVLYWFNAENGLFLRFGADGTVVISDTRKFRSFSNKAAKWLRGKDTPAFDQGIRAVWDDRSKEAIWTFTGWRDLPQWVASQPFPISTTLAGTVVRNDNAPSDTYENLPRFFKCKESHVASVQNEPGVGPDWQSFWEQIAYDDFDYYSVFTVAHNEMTNGFKTFYGHIPKTYLKWRDTFLSSHPIFRNLLFEHRRGEYCTWYGRAAAGIAPKVEDAYVEMVVNELPEQSVRGVAVGFLSENAPDRVDYRTARHATYSEAIDFEQRDDQFVGPIRGDVSQGQTPELSETMLAGDYMRVKFTIFGGTYNLLHSIYVKTRDRIRRINT